MITPKSLNINGFYDSNFSDKSFTVEQSSLMSVAVYMYDKPILASQGRPNSLYQFYTKTIYYLTVTDIPERSVLPFFTPSNSSMRNFMMLFRLSSPTIEISQPTKVNFSAGQTDLRYNLTNLLVFECDS